MAINAASLLGITLFYYSCFRKHGRRLSRLRSTPFLSTPQTGPFFFQLSNACFLNEARSSNNWRTVSTRAKRSLESIILDPGVKELLLDDAKDFLASKEWYSERGIPFRRGYLLVSEFVQSHLFSSLMIELYSTVSPALARPQSSTVWPVS